MSTHINVCVCVRAVCAAYFLCTVEKFKSLIIKHRLQHLRTYLKETSSKFLKILYNLLSRYIRQ